MLRLTVKIGQQVHIEGIGTISVEEKSGRCVKLGFDTEHGPITIVGSSDATKQPVSGTKSGA